MTAEDAGPLAGLRRALQAIGHDSAASAFQPLADKGLAHLHVRLVGTGLLARLPKQSQIGLGAAAHLQYQARCFERAAASGHVPRLHGVLPPSRHLPRGGLLVQEIVGRPARLPRDLPALVDALAAIHALPLPDKAARAPLLDPADALAALEAEIAAQARYLDGAALSPRAHAGIAAVRARWQQRLTQRRRPRRRLIAFDAHPGNFIVDARGHAVLVDLEKARWSHPALDLAHTTLYTSTTWDLDSYAVLTQGEVVSATERWLRAVGPAASPRWVVPLREAMWLWAVTWCAKWRVLSDRPASATPDGEDWSASRSDAALVTHVRGRVDEYLSADGVERVVDEADGLRRHFGTTG